LNTVLSYLAGLIALLLVAALAGPTFVDWNRFRGEFETQAQKITGREVKIGGDISFVVLPAPHLTLNNVSIANVPGGDNPDFMRIGRIDVEVALTPLLSGDISATSIKIARPQVHLEVARDGANNWRDLVSSSLLGEDSFFAPSSVSLEKVSFEEGTISFSDRHNARHWRVEHLNGNVTATSLVGPMRADLTLDVNDIPIALRLGIGKFASKKAFKISTEIQTLNAPAKLLFSGISTSFTSDARVDGTASFEYGTTKVAEGEAAHAPLRIEAGIVSNGDSATFRNLIVGMAGTTLKGDAQASWRGRPNAKIQLSGEALTLDPLLDRFSDLVAGGNGVPLTGLASLPVPGWIDGRASIKVDGLLSHDVLIKNAAIDLALKDGTLLIRQARGDIPGGSHVEVSGDLRGGDAPQFTGKVAASSNNIGGLAVWLQSLRSELVVATPKTGNDDSKAPVVASPLKLDMSEPVHAAVARPFALVSQVKVTPDSLAFTGIRAAYAAVADPADVSGSVSFAPQAKRVVLSVDLAANKFDLDLLRALWPVDAKLKDLLDAYDFDLEIKAQHLIVQQKDVRGLELTASVADDALALKHFHADQFAGATLDFAGALSGLSQNSFDALQGTLNGTIKADKAGEFFALMGVATPGLDASADIAADFSSGHAVDSDAPLDTLTLKGALGASRVDAVLKRGRSSSDAPDAISLIANASNSDGRLLLRQLGFEANDRLSGAGSASLQMGGPVGQPYDTTFRLNVGEGTFMAKGMLSDPSGTPGFVGHVDVSASGLNTVMAALGAPDYVAQFAAAQADGPSFVLSGNMKSSARELSFDSVEVVTGNLHLAGDIALTRDDAGQTRKLSGAIETNLLDLTPIFVDKKLSADGEEPLFVWSAAPLNWSALSLGTGELDVKAAKVRMGTLQFDDAVLHLSLADNVLSAAPVTAKMADGSAAITARIEGGTSGEPGIGLTFKLDDADLAKLGPQIAGTPFASGRISFDMRAEAQGRSWLALVSSIDGDGTLKLSNVQASPLDVAGYAQALNNMTSIDQLAGLKDNVLAKGQTSIDGLDGDFVIKDGTARMTRKDLVLTGGKGSLNAMFDLPRLAIDSELDVVLSDPVDAPGFSDVMSGRVGAVSRRIDTLALQQYASRRFIAQSAAAAGLKSIPKELQNLMGLPEGSSGIAPSVAGVPVPIAKPQQPASALQ
jgi:uncharacterized protein involved in outer membrane biogenesis